MSNVSMMDFKDFMGLEGFFWFYGVVEDRKDPLYLGRVKVRCIGFHTDDKENIPTEHLPWADVIQPVTSAAISGIGRTPTGLIEGTHVFGFFRDGREAQEPVILGTSGGIPENFSNPDRGFYDPRTMAERQNAPYPPLAIDRFRSGIPAKVIEHNQYSEGQYTFVGDTPLKDSTIFFGKNEDESKVQASVYKLKDLVAGAAGGPASPSPKAKPVLVSQLFSRNPDENRMVFDPDGKPILSLPSTNLLGLNRTKFKNRKQETFDKQSKDPKSAKMPLGNIQLNQHRISGSLQSTQEQIHGRVEKSDGSVWQSAIPTHFNPEYPYNHVTYTESGHLLEFDDTPGGERVRLLHRTQSFLEFYPDGSKVESTVGHQYNLVDGQSYTHIIGDDIKNVRGRLDRVYNSRSAGNSKILFDGSGDVNLEIREGSFDTQVRNGDFIVEAKNIKFIGTAKDEGASVFKLEKMQLDLWDPTNKVSKKSQSERTETGESTLVATSIENNAAGNQKFNAGSDFEQTAEGSFNVSVKGLHGAGIKHTCMLKPITLESQNVSRASGGIKLNSGPKGLSTHLNVDGQGVDISTKLGNITTKALAGKFEASASSGIKFDTKADVQIENKFAKVELSSGGLIALKGKGSDVHTLLKNLHKALKAMTFPTPSGSSGPAQNMADFDKFEQEIDKVFKA